MHKSDAELIEILAAEMREEFYGHTEDIPQWGAKVEDRDKWLRLGRWAFVFGENFMASYGVDDLTEDELINLLPEVHR